MGTGGYKINEAGITNAKKTDLDVVKKICPGPYRAVLCRILAGRQHYHSSLAEWSGNRNQSGRKLSLHCSDRSISAERKENFTRVLIQQPTTVQTIPASGFTLILNLGPPSIIAHSLCTSLLSCLYSNAISSGKAPLITPLQCFLQSPVWVPLTGLWCPFTLRGCLHFPWLVILVQGAFDDAACRVTLCISVSGPQQHHLRCGGC